MHKKKRVFTKVGGKKLHRKKKGFVKKRGAMDRTSIIINRTPSDIIPDKYRTKMVYRMTARLNGASAYKTQIISGNGIYDCDLTGGGHQPLGYNELSALYNFYLVRGSQLRVEVLNGDSNKLARVAMAPILTALGINFPVVVAEKPYAKNLFVPINAAVNHQVMQQYMSTKKIVGYTSINDNVTLQGTSGNFPIGSNPLQAWVWVISASGVSTTDLFDTWCDIKVTYYVDWFDRKDIASSLQNLVQPTGATGATGTYFSSGGTGPVPDNYGFIFG